MNSIPETFQTVFSGVTPPDEDNSGLYVTTTESNEKVVLADAAKYKVGAAKVALFTSGLFGLNLASVRGTESGSGERVEYLLNVDYSSTVRYFWENVKPIIVNNGLEETIEKISKFILDNHAKLYPECSCCSFGKAQGAVRSLGNEIKEGVSWLSNDDKFGRIQSIFRANKFACVRADLTDEKATEALADALKNKNLSLDSIYLSNIREYTECDQKLELFQKAMEQLKVVSTPETLVVDTKVRDGGNHSHEKQMQQVRKGFLDASMKEYFPPSPRSACPQRGERSGGIPRGLPGNVVVLNAEDLFSFLQIISGNQGGVIVMSQDGVGFRY